MRAPTKEELDTVRKTARLARLAMPEEELATFAVQFTRILEAFQTLAKLEVEGIEPMTGATEQTDVLREDRAKPSLDLERALANAPARNGAYYEVPKTVGGEA